MNSEPIDEKRKAEIDAMDYRSMLELWRCAPVGHPMFQGAVGAYYSEAMQRKRAEVGPAAHTAASKSIGWD